jgi:cyclopropane-fatty-acyl-phospholipid synthase
MNTKELATQILGRAGIEVNGNSPWSIQVHNEKLWDRVISQPQLGLGEAYMDGWWDCEAIDVMLTKLLESDVLGQIRPTLALASHRIKSTVLNRQTKSRAIKNAKRHYNIGNDLYTRMLDPELVYSCGYWTTATDLASAQIAKLDLICKKLHLKPQMKILDIGCGWGGCLERAVQKFDVNVIGITLSKEQSDFARQRLAKLDTDRSIQIIKIDFEKGFFISDPDFIILHP